MKGVWNKILKVDLTEKKATTEHVPDDVYAYFLGGEGLAAWVLNKECPCGTTAFDPANRLTFAVGPMQGIKQSGAAKWAVGGISPSINMNAGSAITHAFEGEEYEKQKRVIAQQISEKQEAKLTDLGQKADSGGFVMVRTPSGLAFAPKTAEGETMSREIYEALSAEEQKRIDDELAKIKDEIKLLKERLDEKRDKSPAN